MKKIIIILLILLIGLGIFFFFFSKSGKETLSDFFGDNTFGRFFDVEPQSQNDVVADNPTPIPDDVSVSGPFVAPVLRRISLEPISGYTSYSTTTIVTSTTTVIDGSEVVKESKASSTAVRFQERATGHIFDVFEFQEAPIKVSNETVSKIYNTIFSANKDKFLFQIPVFNNEQIQTSFSELVFSTSSDQVDWKVKDISAIINTLVYLPTLNKIVYVVPQNGNSSIYIANPDRSGEKLITTLPFNEFLMERINSNEVLITTKASRELNGYSYILNITNGSFNKILGDIPGLITKVSPDKKYYVYSQSEMLQPSVKVYNSTNKTTKVLPIDTIPEKCVFAEKDVDSIYCFGSQSYESAVYPDDWYKGKVFNKENLYKIDMVKNDVVVMYNFDADKLNFDVINPTITSNNKFVLFENKYDLTLWSLDIERLSKQIF